MKKIILLLCIVSVFGLTGCSNDDNNNSNYVDNDTYSEVFEPQPINFLPDAQGNYSVIVPLDPKIYASDVVLVYRLRGTNSLGNDIWEPLPTEYSFDEGSLSYYFDFSQDDVVLYLYSDFDPALQPAYSRNQIFRIVLVPGYVADNLTNRDYDTVMSAVKDAKGSVEIQTIK